MIIEDRCAALDEVDRAIERLSESSGASSASADRWVHGELTRAVRYDVLTRDCCSSAGALLSRENVARYMAAAEAQDLAVIVRRNVIPRPENSSRVRRRVLRRVAGALGLSLELPPPPPPRHHSPVTARQQRQMLGHVIGWADASWGHRRDMGLRLACVVALVLETSARTSELLALTVDDFADDLSEVSLARRPQGLGARHTETLPLSPGARRAIRPWLERRAQLVAPLRGTPPRALLVSIRPGSSLRYAGLPITGTGALQEQYAAAVSLLNADQAAARAVGWQPLPRTLERLRHCADKADQAPEAPVARSRKNTATTAA